MIRSKMTTTGSTRSSPNRHLFVFESVLGFDENGEETTIHPQKQLACVRCYNQKLGCVRREHNGTCEKCCAANVECMVRQPQRMGRPRPNPYQTSQGGSSTVTKSSGSTTENNNFSSVSTSESSETAWSICSPPTPLSPDLTIQSHWSADNPISSQDWTITDVFGTSMDMGFGTCWAVPETLPNFDDIEMLQTEHLRSSSSDTPYTEAGSLDSIEKLTTLNLETHKFLYDTCSTEVDPSADRQFSQTNVAPTTTQSINQAFRHSEIFMEILRELVKYAGSNSSASRPPPNQSYNLSDDFDIDNAGTLSVDCATGLMAMSCYIRILRIFETIVSDLSTSTFSPQKGSSLIEVELHIGNFSPQPDNGLKVRLLLQFTLHLLDSMCYEVKHTLGTEAVFGQTARDVRNREITLRKRLVATLCESFI